jgi:Fe-S-cluster formation regulator IscX/YfhJ
MEDESPQTVLRLMRDQHRVLVDVATGDVSIADVDAAYVDRRDRLRPLLMRYRIEDPFPWRDLWAYWREEARPLATYDARRQKLAQRIEQAENEILRLRDAGVTDWSSDEVAPNWSRVHARLHGMKDVFRRAVELDDFQDVSRRCREVIIEAAQLVHRPWMVPDGEDPPQAANGKAKIDQICSAVLSGSSNERLRKALRAALELANEGTHSSSTARLQAMAAAQATVMVVRTLQEVERVVEARERSERQIDQQTAEEDYYAEWAAEQEPGDESADLPDDYLAEWAEEERWQREY